MQRYKVNKIGFVNFWLYDEEEFYFYDGKLLLRGTNGSGKTVTMQSFFPLIFDGNRSPERLDPFGSRDRKMEHYLLPENFSGNENTGYLYMEFYNQETKQYLTLGIGLRAIRNRTLEFWGFAITDNRRIGSDFLLFKERQLRIPLTKKELQMRLGTGGIFVENQKDYKRMVNQLLFGFPNIDMYTEFVNLMIQIRSPKLSNSTRPRELTRILSTVLEPLNEADLRVMADSIEGMNKYKETLADLQNELKACEAFIKVYQEYNSFILYHKGEQYMHQKQEWQDFIAQQKEKSKEMDILKADIEANYQEKANLQLEQKDLENKKAHLEATDLKNISAQLNSIIDTLKELETSLASKEKELEVKEDAIQTSRNELKNQEDEMFQLERQFDSLLKDLSDLEEDIQFADIQAYVYDLKHKRFQFSEIESFLLTLKRQIDQLTLLKEKLFQFTEKEKEINQEKEKYILLSDQIKEQKDKMGVISKQLIAEKERLKATIAHTSEHNLVLKLESPVLQAIYEAMDLLHRDYIVTLKEMIKNQIYIYKDEIHNRISDNKKGLGEYQLKLETKTTELESISTILTSNLEDDVTKQYFIENQIPYHYFFELIEFQEFVSEPMRKRIESFLLETGLLTSFVVKQQNLRSDIKLKCLIAGQPVAQNLLEYLKLLETPFQDVVTEILASIAIVEEGSIKLLEDGTYQYALICGNTDTNYVLKYIGDQTRTQYIDHLKEQILLTIRQLTKEIERITEETNHLKENLKILEEEFQHFSFQDTLSDYFKQLDDAQLELTLLEKNSVELVSKIKEKTNEKNNIQKEVEKLPGYRGTLQYSELVEMLNSTKSYFEGLQEVPSLFSKYHAKQELALYYKQTVEDKYQDADYLKLELETLDFKLKEVKNKKQTIEDMLNSEKYKGLAQQYSHIKTRLLELQEEIPHMIECISKQEVLFETGSAMLEELSHKIEQAEILHKVTYQIFMDEYQLNYIQEGALLENEIGSWLKTMKPNHNLLFRDVSDKFYDAANKYLPFLNNYASKYTMLHVVKENAYLDFTQDVSLEVQITQLLEEAKRRDLIFNYKGKSVNLLDLSNTIRNSVQSYQELISAENRKLFEDLLINNLGLSIRQKINASEEWIEEVKTLMESMHTTSGLSFSLKWVGVEPLTEEELDTKEIVHLLKSDSERLKESDLEKISTHFRSKITRKEEALEESERNYLEIIKEVLDYRKWFEFKLLFKRGNQEKKELTDREFNKMSGGEKAIAMYIPLFASIYAKLNSAYETAPKVIALDEAFAGVDDDNIKDAFRILEKLDIDFVLTSQQLWGDYETIKHLAISELHHPIHSNVVSIIRYKWDGIQRSRVEGESDYECERIL